MRISVHKTESSNLTLPEQPPPPRNHPIEPPVSCTLERAVCPLTLHAGLDEQGWLPQGPEGSAAQISSISGRLCWAPPMHARTHPRTGSGNSARTTERGLGCLEACPMPDGGGLGVMTGVAWAGAGRALLSGELTLQRWYRKLTETR